MFYFLKESIASFASSFTHHLRRSLSSHSPHLMWILYTISTGALLWRGCKKAQQETKMKSVWKYFILFIIVSYLPMLKVIKQFFPQLKAMEEKRLNEKWCLNERERIFVKMKLRSW